MIRGDVLRARRQSTIFFPSDLHKSHIPAPKALNATYVAIKSIIGREDDDDDDSHAQATNQLCLVFAGVYSLQRTPATDDGNPGNRQIFAACVFAISTMENPACLSPMLCYPVRNSQSEFPDTKASAPWSSNTFEISLILFIILLFSCNEIITHQNVRHFLKKYLQEL